MLEPSSKSPLFLYIIAGFLAAVTLFFLWPYSTSFFEAAILFILLNPVYKYLLKKGVGKGLSASLLILGSFIVILLPLIFGVSLFTSELISFTETRTIDLSFFQSIKLPFTDILERFDISVVEMAKTSTSKIVSGSGNFLLSTIGGVTDFTVNIFMMYILFYFILTSQEKWQKMIRENWPSDEEYLDNIQSIIVTNTQSAVISTVVIAILQGLLVGFGLLITSTPYTLLLTILTILLSFLPLVGAPFVWIPAAIYHLFQHNIFAVIVLLIIGAIASVSDNLLRAWIQNRLGEIHPLTTIMGVLIGITMFGMIGLIIGPIVISLTISLSLYALKEFNARH